MIPYDVRQAKKGLTRSNNKVALVVVATCFEYKNDEMLESKLLKDDFVSEMRYTCSTWTTCIRPRHQNDCSARLLKDVVLY